jgi:hypothetical protein
VNGEGENRMFKNILMGVGVGLVIVALLYIVNHTTIQIHIDFNNQPEVQQLPVKSSDWL